MKIFGLIVTSARRFESDWRAEAVIAAEDMLIDRLRDRKSQLFQAVGRCARAEAKDWIEESGPAWLRGVAARSENQANVAPAGTPDA